MNAFDRLGGGCRRSILFFSCVLFEFQKLHLGVDSCLCLCLQLGCNGVVSLDVLTKVSESCCGRETVSMRRTFRQRVFYFPTAVKQNGGKWELQLQLARACPSFFVERNWRTLQGRTKSRVLWNCGCSNKFKILKQFLFPPVKKWEKRKGVGQTKNKLHSRCCAVLSASFKDGCLKWQLTIADK